MFGSTNGPDTNCAVRCDRFGAHQEIRRELALTQQREALTTKTGCRFQLWAYKDVTWPTPHLWYFEIRYGMHNHQGRSAELLAPQRQATDKQKLWIRQMQTWGISNRCLMNLLNNLFPGHSLNYRAIKYGQEVHKKETYCGLSSAQMLEHKLQRANIPFTFWTDHESTLTALLILNQDAVRLYQRLPMVILMDCTYRTNQYNMPTLHIMGVSGTGRGYSIGIALLSKETIPFYWAVLTDLRMKLGQLEPQAIVTDR